MNCVNQFHLGKTVSFRLCLRLLGLMASVITVVPLGLLFMRDFQRWTASLKLNPSRHLQRWVCISAQCLKSLLIWRDRTFLTEGVPMGVVSNRKVVTTDAFSLGWGAIMEGQPVNGVWTESVKIMHINCLELLAVFFGPQTLPPADKRLTYVSKIKQHNSSCVYKQARGVRSRSLHSLGKRVLLWSKKHLLSLRETHVPGQMNIRADLLSRGNPLPGEWRLHPEVVQRIWDKYGQERVDLFASEENTHCPLFFSLKGMNAPLGMDALAHPWPETLLYAFPPISLIPPTLSKNQITEGEGAPNSPVMARQDLDSRDSATAVFASVASSSVQRPSLSGGGEDFSSTSGEVESLGLARERSNLNSECDLDHSAC